MASIDIIEKVRHYLGSEPVPKIDPNTQAPNPKESTSFTLQNKALPAVLVGFYKHTRNEKQAAELMNENDSGTILNTLFGDRKNDIIRSISTTTSFSEDAVQQEMINSILAVKRVLHEEIKNPDGKSVNSFFTAQRSNILKHLPPELNMGELMMDSSVDDRTNKMEGPMSDMMHTVEKIFSSTK